MTLLRSARHSCWPWTCSRRQRLLRPFSRCWVAQWLWTTVTEWVCSQEADLLLLSFLVFPQRFLSNYDTIFQLPVEGYPLLLNAVQPRNCIHQLHSSLTEHRWLYGPDCWRGFGMECPCRNMFTHYDRAYIGQLCEKAGLMQWVMISVAAMRFSPDIWNLCVLSSISHFQTSMQHKSSWGITIFTYIYDVWLWFCDSNSPKSGATWNFLQAMEHYTDGTDLKRVMPLPYWKTQCMYNLYNP